MRIPRRYLSFVLVIAATSAHSSARGEQLLLIQEVPRPSELAEIMFPDSPGAPDVRVRSIRFTTSEEVPAAVEAAPAGAPEETSGQGMAVGFNIQFALDSAQLLPDSLPYLDSLGQMLLQERTRDARLRIAGHADASGDGPHNLALSQARARSVYVYLRDNYNIEGGRLETVGFGEEMPLPDVDPADAMNRRVEFHPIN